MLVQRLTKRLATFFSHLTARLRTAFTSLTPRERRLAAEASPRNGHVGTQQSGSWLDDAHRLRPRHAALATADPRRGKHDAPNEPPPAPHTPRAGTPAHPIAQPTPPQPQEPKQGRPWVFPAHPAPTPPQPAAMPGASEGDEALARRRLMSLKYLVRIGLYNEGFAPSAVPEQYQHSLGAEEEE